MSNPYRETSRHKSASGLVLVASDTRDLAPRQSATSIAIGIASAGRPLVLRQTVDHLMMLAFPAARIIICVPELSDASESGSLPGCEVILSPRGLTTQRNNILRAAAGSQVLLFLDDDFLPAPDFLRHIERAFTADPDLVIATGRVLADGILTGGLSVSYALEQLNAADQPDDRITDVYNAYGCNMAVRLEPILRHKLSFDEQLPLYGWLEDVDFSRSIARHGRSALVWGARGVHLGVKSGRQSGLKLGYSQVVNPLYLASKGTMAPSRAIAQLGRNILANLRGFIMRDKSIDRPGRLLGNLRAIGDLLTLRASPMRILSFERPAKVDVPLASHASSRRS
jgi:hypothetical protein